MSWHSGKFSFVALLVIVAVVVMPIKQQSDLCWSESMKLFAAARVKQLAVLRVCNEVISNVQE